MPLSQQVVEMGQGAHIISPVNSDLEGVPGTEELIVDIGVHEQV